MFALVIVILQIAIFVNVSTPHSHSSIEMKIEKLEYL